MVYLSFFHARIHPNEAIKEARIQGPIVGPVKISFTYGALNIFNPFDETAPPIEIECIEGHFQLRGVFYGELEVLTEDDSVLSEIANNLGNYTYLTYHEL